MRFLGRPATDREWAEMAAMFARSSFPFPGREYSDLSFDVLGLRCPLPDREPSFWRLRRRADRHIDLEIIVRGHTLALVVSREDLFTLAGEFERITGSL